MQSLTRRSLFASAALAALAPGISARDALAQAAPTRLSIVTTTAMLADAVRMLAGDQVRVEALMGEGVDPHLYRPTRADIVKLTQADMVIAHGLGLEAQFRETFRQIARRRAPVMAAESIPKDQLLKDEEVADKPDPHVWMDPKLWITVVRAVSEALAAADIQGRRKVTPDLSPTVAKLEALATYAGQVLASVAPERRMLVTAHDAFSYLARAYGLEVHGIQGLSTESEAGLRAIEATVDLIVSRRIPAVFVESSVSDRNIRAVIEGAARRGHRVTIGAELFSDAMGKPGTYEGTYLGMIDHNVTAIARALGGTAPEKGMSGRLTG
ncbi:metal ABC transporter solute-binding protein, Zn/Mn family [Phreatobacter oligotrophus]|uniref:Manganese/zinc/iron transport system substrate-binding protein n=1 Tax=Phreatobacter oligotrophus TaxID=1122261 RepID=A0A2T4YYB9_9HYPH|nr:zinc ABC transporter substrate-binding protein [Phreatobacter oligotrophus]PTM51748.1 manganese/zinc/iron transport system substrate-binding protein [Phreatobacter oligotrophus]